MFKISKIVITRIHYLKYLFSHKLKIDIYVECLVCVFLRLKEVNHDINHLNLSS